MRFLNICSGLAIMEKYWPIQYYWVCTSWFNHANLQWAYRLGWGKGCGELCLGYHTLSNML